MQELSVDLDCLRSFVTVAERLNFHEAAIALRISGPALTRRIQRLEATLGAPLLERNTRRVVATSEGLVFLTLARQALDAVDNAVETVRQAARVRAGHLVLACVPTMTYQVLPQIIREFHASWPQVHVRVIECGAGAVEQAVRDGSASFGFGFPLGGGIDADLTFGLILTDPYCLILPTDHVLAEQEQVCWRELKSHRVITAGRQSGNMKVLNEALLGVDWRSDTEYEVDHLTTSLGLVEAGLGIAVVPRSALPAQLPSGMAMRPLGDPVATRRLGIFRRRNWTPTPAAKHFVTAVRRTAAGLRLSQAASSA
jgi:DNA-binding transcriptional LysR family regulator